MQTSEIVTLDRLTVAVKQAVATNFILRDRMAEGGQCFHLAFFAAKDLSAQLDCDCLVVHAILGNGLVHAWTEVDGRFCVDLTLAADHPQLVTSAKADFYAQACPSVSRAYGVLEAWKLTMTNSQKLGPWHSPFTEQLAENHRAAMKSANDSKPESEIDEKAQG